MGEPRERGKGDYRGIRGESEEEEIKDDRRLLPPCPYKSKKNQKRSPQGRPKFTSFIRQPKTLGGNHDQGDGVKGAQRSYGRPMAPLTTVTL